MCRRLRTARNDERRRVGAPLIRFGLALHVGEVLYGNIGAEGPLNLRHCRASCQGQRPLCRISSLKAEIPLTATVSRSAKRPSPSSLGHEA